MAESEGPDGGITDARTYLEQRYREGSTVFETRVARVGLFHELYKKYCRKADSPQTRSSVLEIGSGATFCSAIGLAPFVSSIVLSAYGEEELKEAELWRESSPKAFNWQPFVSAVLRQYEGPSEVKSAEIREEEVRKKLTAIVHCDLKKKGIIDPNYVPEGGFDVVTCIEVLAVAASTMEEFHYMFENIHSIMKPGGLFMVRLGAKTTYYHSNLESVETSPKYSVLYVTRADVEQALEKAGFIMKEFTVYPAPESPLCNISDTKEVYVFVCAA